MSSYKNDRDRYKIYPNTVKLDHALNNCDTNLKEYQNSCKKASKQITIINDLEKEGLINLHSPLKVISSASNLSTLDS